MVADGWCFARCAPADKSESADLSGGQFPTKRTTRMRLLPFTYDVSRVEFHAQPLIKNDYKLDVNRYTTKYRSSLFCLSNIWHRRMRLNEKVPELSVIFYLVSTVLFLWAERIRLTMTLCKIISIEVNKLYELKKKAGARELSKTNTIRPSLYH